MKKHQLATLVWLVAAISAAGQTLVDVRTQTKNVDFSGAASTIPAKSGAAVPASCKLGEMFFNTSNAPGQNLYLCAPANTWTLLAGGSGGSTAGTVLSANAGQFAYYAANGSAVTGHTLVAGDIPSLSYQTPLTFTGNGAKTASSTGTTTANDCAKWDASGNVIDAGAPCGSGSGGSSAFASLTAGTNTSAAMLIGTGASLAATGTGTIAATSVPASGVSGLATSATTDTTNASNIASGTLAAARLPAGTLTASSASGTGSKYASATAAGSANNCAKWDANGNVADAGVACGTSASSVLQASSHIAEGDSITFGYLTSASYASLLANDERAALLNHAISGYQACDLTAAQTLKFDGFQAADNNPIYTLMIGTNDANNKGTGAYEAVYKGCHQAAIAWNAVANKFLVTDTTAPTPGICHNSGTWTYQAGGGGSNWIVANDVSFTNGSTKACPLTTYGGPIYFWYYVQDGHTATFTYAVDGGTAVSLNGFTTPAIAATSGVNYGMQLARIPVSAGAHNVVFTITGTSGNSNSAEAIFAIGTPPAQPYYGGPKVFVAGVPRTNGDANSATFAAYNADAQADVNLLAGDGLGVYFVDIRKYLCTSIVSGQCYGPQGVADMNVPGTDAGGLHPNTLGHTEIKQAFEQAMQFTPYVAPYTGTGGKTVTSTAAGVSGDCAKWDANGNVVDAGSPCGTGSSGTGSGTVNTATAGQFAYYNAAGTAVSGHTLVAGDIPTLSYDATGAAAAVQTASLQKSNNLSDLASVATARTNLGISFTGTGAKTISSTAAGASGNCAKWDANGNVVDAGATCGTSSGGSSAWSALTSGTNTSGAFIIGSGASLSASGTGAITATSVPATGVSGTLPDAQLPSDQCTLTKYSVAGSQLTALASATPTIQLTTLAGTSTRICLVEISGSTSFTGGAISAATVRVQSGASTPMLYSPNQDVFGTVGPATNNYWTDSGNMVDRTNQGVVAAFTFTGANSSVVAPGALVYITIGTRTMP